MTKITDEMQLLDREAALASQLLGTGLTVLRKYNFADKGYFYSGIFSITIGLERILKLVLIYDFRLSNNDKFPEYRYLKNKGHKIDELVKFARKINHERNLAINENYLDDNLIIKILKFLTDFAISSRYYNLDNISGRIHNENEPLARWDTEVCSIILQRHFRMSKNKQIMTEIAKKISDSTFVFHSHEDGSVINTVDDFISQSHTIECKQKYSIYYTYQIIKFVVGIFIELEKKQVPQTNLWESFILFHFPRDSSILRKKIWDPCRL